jgi:diguanylate cyclase (GGDEF)-like protein/PAS domain S-box-containing protein
VIATVFGLFITANWVWPLVVFVDDESEAFDLDECFFIVLVLLVPSALTVIVFALATIISQAIKRRPLVKSIFNVGQVVASAGVGVTVFGFLNISAGAINYSKISAALVGAFAYYAMNTGAVAVLLMTLGTPWRKTVFGGFEAKLLILLGSISLAIPTALVVQSDIWFLPVAVLPLLLMRHLGAGHFYARHDRARLRGLFAATLEVNRSLGDQATRSAILHSARMLLRSPDASLGDGPPPEDSLAAPLELGTRRLWLTVSGRSRTEPFDNADRALIEALASVGAVALTNTTLYDEVELNREKLSLITKSLGEGVCAVNHAGEITFMNPAGSEMLGWSLAESGGQHGAGPFGSAVPDVLIAAALHAMDAGQIITSDDARFQRADGMSFPVTLTASPISEGDVHSGAVVIFRDISERKKFEEELARHAFEDPLTGLANRRLLIEHLDQALLRADRAGQQVVVMFCDVDRFKIVNDSLGHQVGDEILSAIADRLRGVVRPGDTLSRFGGDEFIILLEGLTSNDEPARVAANIQKALHEPVLLDDGHEVVITISIGIAFGAPGKSRDDVLHDADVAMFRAKDRGRGGQFVVFDADAMGARSTERVDLETELHHALERNEIEVYYQPLVSLTDRRVVGAEALVRWNHPRHGLLLPAQFIQLAEDSGLILPIGKAVLEQACRQGQLWREAYGVTLEIGVNLSARQFQQVGLVDDIEKVLRATGIEPVQLCLEITESLAMEDIELTAMILFRLHTLGVRVAIDDFGTGHSSLGYLARFPIDVVKIDRTFIMDIATDRVQSAIVSAVVALSKAIDSTVVVEGVETLAQLEHVQSLGCEIAQGFYFARPMTAMAFERHLSPPVTVRPELRVVKGRSLAG